MISSQRERNYSPNIIIQTENGNDNEIEPESNRTDEFESSIENDHDSYTSEPNLDSVSINYYLNNK